MQLSADVLGFVGKRRFGTVLADPPWRFKNNTGKIAPEHRRLARYGTLSLDEIKALPIGDVAADTARGPGGYVGVGLRVQVQYRLAQDTQGRRP